MTRFGAAVRFDIRLQLRQGFYAAYVIISAVYIVLLRSIGSGEAKEMAEIVITFSDPSMLGFYFVGGLVLLEKNQRILDPLMVTPLRVREYLMSKVISLAFLSAMAGSVVRLGAFGLGGHWFGFVAGMLLTSIFFTLFGLGVAVRCCTVNQYFIESTLSALVFTLPVLDAVHVWSTPLFYLLPSKASLLLIESMFSRLGVWEYVYGFGSLIVWIVLAYVWADRSFRRFVVLRAQEGREAAV
ncbi:ABC transporter permease [Paenibacillus thermotolerans]|uniref:fluoroquinolone export ABC transporter permease subunit n=1 Tax=Paenibacillus thermotolerans TaxID=3027807 RepID=UPI002368ADDC|nr:MULTISPECIES: ABC transporter permease [unclassified Paenibacillus]